MKEKNVNKVAAAKFSQKGIQAQAERRNKQRERRRTNTQHKDKDRIAARKIATANETNAVLIIISGGSPLPMGSPEKS
jgi:hypothetical protein